MNVVVLGGNCLFSSELSKALNKKLSNSVVVRTNLLKDLRRIILPKAPPTVINNAGEYIGDVELIDKDIFKSLAKPEFKNITIKLKDSVTNFQKGLTFNNKKVREENFLNDVFKINDILSELLPARTKAQAFFKSVYVFSGVCDIDMLQKYTSAISGQSFKGPTAYIIVKDTECTWLDSEITEETLNDFYKTDPSLLGPIFDVSNVEELLENKEFLAFVNYVSPPQKSSPVEKRPLESTRIVTLDHDFAVFNLPRVGELVANAA